MSNLSCYELAEELKALSSKLQVINNYDLNLDGLDFEKSLKRSNGKAKRLYQMAEIALEEDFDPGAGIDVSDEFYSGTIILEDGCDGSGEWIMMDSDTLSNEYNQLLEQHRANRKEAESRDPEEVLQEAVDDYKYFVHSVLRYELRDGVDYPSKERDGSEIL